MTLIGQFFTLAAGGGVNIFQPEPMSLGGITNTLAVADLLGARQLYRAAPERRPSRDGSVFATCRMRAQLSNPGAFRSV